MLSNCEPTKLIFILVVLLTLQRNSFAQDVEIENTFTVYQVAVQCNLDTAYISPTPGMPNVLFTAVITPDPPHIEDVSFEWNLVLTFDQHGRQDIHNFSAVIEGDDEWSPDWGDLIAGGDIQVSLVVNIDDLDIEAGLSGNSIKGDNPEDSSVISALGGGSPAVEIACWESGHSLSQFDSYGWPLFGAPNGWGIMQIDNPPIACPLTEEDIWDWRANVDTGLCVMDVKRNDASGYPSRIRRRGYPNATDFTDQQLLYEAIQRYNGGAYWTWGESLDPSEGQQWIATPPNNYVQNVLSTNCQ